MVELRSFSPKTRLRSPILFISNFGKAAYKYFKYFGPWTADVHGPLLKLCVMNVVMTALAAHLAPAMSGATSTIPLYLQAFSPVGSLCDAPFPQGMSACVEHLAGPKPEPFSRGAGVLACRPRSPLPASGEYPATSGLIRANPGIKKYGSSSPRQNRTPPLGRFPQEHGQLSQIPAGWALPDEF